MAKGNMLAWSGILLLSGAAASGIVGQRFDADRIQDELRQGTKDVSNVMQAAAANAVNMVRSSIKGVGHGGSSHPRISSNTKLLKASPPGSPCAWQGSSSTCRVNGDAAEKWMEALSKDSVLRAMWNDNKRCQAFTDSTSCQRDSKCQFSLQTGECAAAVSPDQLHGLMGKFMSERNCGWIAAMQDGVTCALINGSSANCTGSCMKVPMWLPRGDMCVKEEVCAMSEEKSIKKMCGDDFDFFVALRECGSKLPNSDEYFACFKEKCEGLGTMMVALYGNTAMCRALNSSQACQHIETCMWHPSGECVSNQLVSIAGTLPDECMVKELLYVKGTCTAQPKENCTKDCSWEMYQDCNNQHKVDKSSCLLAGNRTWQMLAADGSEEAAAFARLWSSTLMCDDYADEVSCNAAQHIQIGNETTTTTTSKPSTSSSPRGTAAANAVLPLMGVLGVFAALAARV